MKVIKEILVVIPSLSPEKTLINYVDDLIRNGFRNIIVVNDGSSKKYDSIFNTLSKRKGVKVLKHDVNRGKGAALKTAFVYIKKNYKKAKGILTVDSDGQHIASDCLNITTTMLKGKRGLYLGCRDFNNPNVPSKSRLGNKLTSLLFKLLYKQELSDTQTGLRGFFVKDLDLMIDCDGERYEYEMEMLIKACLNNLKLICIPIQTIYINQNEGSHFRPLKDGLKVYKILFRKHYK